MNTVSYGKYAIKSFLTHVAATGHRTLNISIAREERGAVTMRPFAAEVPYQTEEDADLHGIVFDQRIIGPQSAWGYGISLCMIEPFEDLVG